jgi:exopolysaccharide biosynthesis polyprenyl glycosylphosphotransferase
MGPKLREITRQVLLYALRVIDAGLIILSFGLGAIVAVHATTWPQITQFLASKVSLSSCVLLAIAMLFCCAVFSACGLYQLRQSSSRRQAFDILRAMTISTACLWLESKTFSIYLVTPLFLLFFWALGIFLAVGSRQILGYLFDQNPKQDRSLHHVLVLGTNPRAMEFGRRIEARPDSGALLLGFVDDEWAGMAEFEASRLRLACNFDGLAEFLRHNVVDEVAIYLPLRSFYERAAIVAKLCEQHGILLRSDEDLFDLKVIRNRSEASKSAAYLNLEPDRHNAWHLLLKRMLDVTGSLLLMIALAPLLILVAVLIKITSPGPVLFTQRRVGLNKRQFTMYKFRTMVPAAESIQEKLLHLNEMSGPAFKIKNDPRVTPIGRFLRKTSIDELPQLFNVLIGEMSLVGPRAMSVRDYQNFNEDWQRRRFSVLPGITCLWQIHGRNTIPFEQWMVLDMQYIDRWSLWLDLKILALTIPAVLKGSGAA